MRLALRGFGIAPERVTPENLARDLIAAKDAVAARMVVKNYLCAGMKAPQVAAANAIVAKSDKSPLAVTKTVVAITEALSVEPLRDADRRRMLQCHLTPFVPEGGPYDSIPCVSGDESNWAGNAVACDSHTFTDYDIWGMAQHLWRMDAQRYFTDAAGKRQVIEEPRQEYCGPARSAPFVGDEPVGKTDDGEDIYKSQRDGSYYTLGGPEFCRKNDIDWRAEEVKERAFLYGMKLTADAGDYIGLLRLMNKVIHYKARMRDQWVTNVPGFIVGERGKATNGRYRYVVARVFLKPGFIGANSVTPPKDPVYFYLPAGAPTVEQYKAGGLWRMGQPGGFGRPGFVVVPAEAEGCVAASAVGTTILTVQFLKNWLSGGWIKQYLGPLAGGDPSPYIKWIVGAVKGEKVNFDISGVFSQLDGVQTFYSSTSQICTAQGEWAILSKMKSEVWLPLFSKAFQTAIPAFDGIPTEAEQVAQQQQTQQTTTTWPTYQYQYPLEQPLVPPPPRRRSLLPLALLGAGGIGLALWLMRSRRP